MRTNLLSFISSVCAVMASVSIAAHAQATATSEDRPRPELAVGYHYLHSNAPAGQCGCFGLNGGNASFALPLRHSRLSVVGDIGGAHAGGVASSGLDLTLSTYTAGLRYSVPHTPPRLQPFGQVLLGVAHAGGGFISNSSPAVGNSGVAFAALVGGGVDLRVSHRFALRVVEADYLVTTFDNGGNDHQNNLRIGAGVVLRF